MKNTIFKSLIFISIICLSQLLSAQDRKSLSEADKEKFRASKQELKAYVEKEIKPIISSQRTKLDTYLSTSEKEEVESIRQASNELKVSSRSFRSAMREKSGDKRELSEEELAKSRELQKQKRQIHSRAYAIIDAHETEVYQLLDELKPNMETWRSDMREIRKKHAPDGFQKRGEGARSQPRGKGGRHSGMRGDMLKSSRGYGPGRGGMRNISQLRNPVSFLLFEEKAALPFEEEEMSLEVYPNPSFQNNTLKYELSQADKVEISIYNDQGNLVKSLFSGNQEAGTHKQSFDLSELKEGMYIYRIKTSAGIHTQKLIIEK
ncbi:MAG: T9SS type A sorting domain-containing protein [Bacteroidota bacterium]